MVKALREAVLASGRANYLTKVTLPGSYGERPTYVWKGCLFGVVYSGTFDQVASPLLSSLSSLEP